MYLYAVRAVCDIIRDYYREIEFQQVEKNKSTDDSNSDYHSDSDDVGVSDFGAVFDKRGRGPSVNEHKAIRDD